MVGDIVPDYNDSSICTSQLDSYTSEPPFRPLFMSYREQAIYYDGAYTAALHRLSLAPGKFEHGEPVYNRP
jgi:hypothetical protein